MSDGNAYTTKPEALRQFDLRTAPDRLQAYCDALDRRVEVLERGLLDAGHRIAVLEHRVALLEDAEARA